MANEGVAEARDNLGLQSFNLWAGELNHFSCFDIDKVIVVLPRNAFIARPPVTERKTFNDAFVLEALHCSVNGCQGYALVALGSATMQFINVRMVIGSRQHFCNDFPLRSPAHTACTALGF